MFYWQIDLNDFIKMFLKIVKIKGDESLFD